MNRTLVINMMTAKALELLAMPEDEFNRRNETEMAAEIERLRARVAELEAANDALADAAIVRDADAAITFGTLAQPTPDWPTKIEHNIPPSAPPHDE